MDCRRHHRPYPRRPAATRFAPRQGGTRWRCRHLRCAVGGGRRHGWPELARLRRGQEGLRSRATAWSTTRSDCSSLRWSPRPTCKTAAATGRCTTLPVAATDPHEAARPAGTRPGRQRPRPPGRGVPGPTRGGAGRPTQLSAAVTIRLNVGRVGVVVAGDVMQHKALEASRERVGSGLRVVRAEPG